MPSVRLRRIHCSTKFREMLPARRMPRLPWIGGTPLLVIALTMIVSGCGRTALELTAPGGASDLGPMNACDPTSCTGCCGAAGECLAGTAPSACGSGGTACVVCPSKMCRGSGCSSAVVLFGGRFPVPFGNLNDTWMFDGSSWTQVSVSNPPPARFSAAMATLGTKVALFGGYSTTFLSDTWTFDGTSWTQVPVSNPPPARLGAAMATLGNQVVLFGGSGTTFLSDTWTFDGTNWTQVSVSNPTPARSGVSMATLGQEVVLFGGLRATCNGATDPGCLLNDTWTFDGTSWAPVSVSNPPPALLETSMTTLGNEVVLWGGTGVVDAGLVDLEKTLSDAWTFNGSSWTRVSLPSPPAGAIATLGNEVVAFGGATGNNLLNDTWMFDGSSWTQVSASNPPPARLGAAMATLP